MSILHVSISTTILLPLETSQSMISEDVSTTDVESKTVEPISNELFEEIFTEAQSLQEIEIHVPSTSEPPKVELLSPSATSE